MASLCCSPAIWRRLCASVSHLQNKEAKDSYLKGLSQGWSLYNTIKCSADGGCFWQRACLALPWCCSNSSTSTAKVLHCLTVSAWALSFILWLVCVEPRWFRFPEQKPSCQVDPKTQPWAAKLFIELALALQCLSHMDIPEWAENKGPFTPHISLSKVLSVSLTPQ